MLKQYRIKKYLADRSSIELAEQEKKKQEERSRRRELLRQRQKERLEKRLQQLKDDINVGVVNLEDFERFVGEANDLTASLSKIINNRDADIAVIKSEIGGIQTTLLSLSERLQQTKNEIPNLNDFRLEINKRINTVVDELTSKLKSIKIKSYDTEIAKIETSLLKKADKKDVPKQVKVLGTKNVKVIKEEKANETIYRIYADLQNIIVGGNGGAAILRDDLLKGLLDARYVNVTGDTMTGDLQLYNNILHTLNYSMTVPATGTVALLGIANVFTTQQMVDGSSDQIQLRVQAHSTQTANTFVVEKSTGAELGGFDGRGIVFSHGGTPPTNFFMGGGNNAATGGDNLAIGLSSLYSLTNGLYNIGVGSNSLNSLTTGRGNVAIGYTAMFLETGSYQNTAIGFQSLYSHSGTSAQGSNVSIGEVTLFSLTTGSKNTALGGVAGLSNLTGVANIYIGYYAGAYHTGSNTLIIDNRDRTNSATEVTNAIIYGTMAALPANQTLRINAALTIEPTVAGALTLGAGTAGIDYQLKFDGETNDGILTWMEDENYFTSNTPIHGATSLYRRYYHLPLGSANPGGSGATFVEAGANTTGGWRLTNSTWLLRGQADIHADWDGASDMKVGVNFMVNVDNTGGGVGDTVDLRLNAYYKGLGDTATKTQAVEVATTVGQSAQYKQFRAEFTLNWDETSNVIEIGDIIALVLNLETDTSEVDDIVVTSMEFSYNTTHSSIESGDI